MQLLISKIDEELYESLLIRWRIQYESYSWQINRMKCKISARNNSRSYWSAPFSNCEIWRCFTWGVDPSSSRKLSNHINADIKNFFRGGSRLDLGEMVTTCARIRSTKWNQIPANDQDDDDLNSESQRSLQWFDSSEWIWTRSAKRQWDMTNGNPMKRMEFDTFIKK